MAGKAFLNEKEMTMKIKTITHVAREALRALENRRGRLTAAEVVAAARPQTSPLHAYFLWNDTVAAGRWRLVQARELIRTVRVQVVTAEGKKVTIPCFVRDPECKADEQGYVTTPRLKTEKDNAAAMLREEIRAVRQRLNRLRALAAYFGGVKHVEQMEHELTDLARLVG